MITTLIILGWLASGIAGVWLFWLVMPEHRQDKECDELAARLMFLGFGPVILASAIVYAIFYLLNIYVPKNLFRKLFP